MNKIYLVILMALTMQISVSSFAQSSCINLFKKEDIKKEKIKESVKNLREKGVHDETVKLFEQIMNDLSLIAEPEVFDIRRRSLEFFLADYEKFESAEAAAKSFDVTEYGRSILEKELEAVEMGLQYIRELNGEETLSRPHTPKYEKQAVMMVINSPLEKADREEQLLFLRKEIKIALERKIISYYDLQNLMLKAQFYLFNKTSKIYPYDSKKEHYQIEDLINRVIKIFPLFVYLPSYKMLWFNDFTRNGSSGISYWGQVFERVFGDDRWWFPFEFATHDIGTHGKELFNAIINEASDYNSKDFTAYSNSQNGSVNEKLNLGAISKYDLLRVMARNTHFAEKYFSFYFSLKDKTEQLYLQVVWFYIDHEEAGVARFERIHLNNSDLDVANDLWDRFANSSSFLAETREQPEFKSLQKKSLSKPEFTNLIERWVKFMRQP